MKTITKEQFQNKIDDYIILAENEEFIVKDGDRVLFYLVPKRIKDSK